MIKKKSLNSAFTLIELLVVITIIGILAGIALPVFNTVQLKGAQTKVLAQAKQVGLALKLYAGDNGGTYPVYVAGTATQSNTGGGTAAGTNNANQDFFPLFPTYTQSEAIFANKYSYYNNKVPDNVLTPAPALTWSSGAPGTLSSGENSFAYMEGLTDSFNPSSPIVFDAPNTAAAATYITTPNQPGYVWGNNKAVVIHLDNSATLDTLSGGGTAGFTDQQFDPNGNGQTKVNYLLPGGANNTSINGCFLVLPVHN